MQADVPAEVRMTDLLGPVGWRYVPSKVWGDQVLTQDPKTAQLARDMGLDVEPLYTEAQMLARVDAERERCLAAVSALRRRLRGSAKQVAAETEMLIERVA